MRPLGDVVADLELGNLIESPERDLVDAWSEFLMRYRFEWFVTFTFRDDVHPERADKLFMLWIDKLNRFLYGQRATRRQGVFWVRALEWQKRGVIHFHALIGATNPISNRISFGADKADPACLMYWNERWFDKAGICRIEEIESDEAVTEYLSKYIFKDGEIDVSENLKDFIPPQVGLLGR